MTMAHTYLVRLPPLGDNNEGVVGVSWQARIMALKFLGADGGGSTADAISCIQYAVQMGADVMNNSWGGGGFEQSLKDAIDAAGASDIAFVAAAGNSSSDNDAWPHYPSSYDSPNIITVVSTDHDDYLSSFSNRGFTSTDLGAPGTDILSCKRGGGYVSFSGTSMAAPHVAGACALMRSMNPSVTVGQMSQALLSTVDSTLPGLCQSGGRLNLSAALSEVGAPWLSVTSESGNGILPGESVTVDVQVGAGDLEGLGISVREDLAPGVYQGEIVVSANDPVTPQVVVPVTMSVLADHLTIMPIAEWLADGVEGGPFTPDSHVYTLTNDGLSSLDWSLSHTVTWLDVSLLGGTLASGESVEVTVSINAEADFLLDGGYGDLLLFRNETSGVDQSRAVSLEILPTPPDLVYCFPMDTDPGWTTEGQWAFGQPQGLGSRCSDPTSGFTGLNVYGYNLAGDYANNMPVYYLTTLPLDFSDYHNVQLRYRSWLGVEESTFDHASVEVSADGVNWVQVWTHTGASVCDETWVEEVYDLSAVADGESTVYVRWSMGQTDSSVTYPGWNIDDVCFEGNPTGVLGLGLGARLVSEGY